MNEEITAEEIEIIDITVVDEGASRRKRIYKFAAITVGALVGVALVAMLAKSDEDADDSTTTSDTES